MFKRILNKIKSHVALINEVSSETLLEINKVEKYFKDPRLLEFLRNYEKLIVEKNSKLYFTTFGINFKDEKVYSVKFYAHILEEMTELELKKFIPDTSDYFSFVNLKNKGNIFKLENIGTVLEIKFKIENDNPTYGFFYQLNNIDESFKEIGFPINLPKHLKNNCTSLGVNFEYGDSKLYKKYYYFDKLETNMFFKEKIGLSIIEEAQFIEYAESDNFFKVNVYTGEIENFCKKVKIFSNNELELINCLNSKYNLINTTYGFYENKSIKSIYFRLSSSKINSNHYKTDTLMSITKQLG